MHGRCAAVDDEPIYKPMPMHTVAGMFKRILLVTAGAALGVALTIGIASATNGWGLLPNRDLNRATDSMKDVLRLVNENYVDEKAVRFDRLAKRALHGMLESLDPHSEYLEIRDMEELSEQLSGDFSGVGLQVEIRDGRVLVIAPIANTPAEKAGIERGDEILAVDGKTVGGDVTTDAIVERLRGKVGTPVTMELFRPSTAARFRLTLRRQLIELETVRAVEVLPDRTGYILISDFSDHTARDFSRALDRLMRENIENLIIDLRNNPGGLLDAAVAVAEPFFHEGEVIVSTRGRKPDDHDTFRAERRGKPLELPVAVLINAATASAAEVVTGALKDTHRAVVVGERSFGKGSVQSVFSLKSGEGLRLTTARYFTPAGLSIHESGISPHVEVVMTAEEDSKLRVQLARADISDPHEFKERFGFTPIADRQLEAAQQILRGLRVLDSRRLSQASH